MHPVWQNRPKRTRIATGERAGRHLVRIERPKDACAAVGGRPAYAPQHRRHLVLVDLLKKTCGWLRSGPASAVPVVPLCQIGPEETALFVEVEGRAPGGRAKPGCETLRPSLTRKCSNADSVGASLAGIGTIARHYPVTEFMKVDGIGVVRKVRSASEERLGVKRRTADCSRRGSKAGATRPGCGWVEPCHYGFAPLAEEILREFVARLHSPEYVNSTAAVGLGYGVSP